MTNHLLRAGTVPVIAYQGQVAGRVPAWSARAPVAQLDRAVPVRAATTAAVLQATKGGTRCPTSLSTRRAVPPAVEDARVDERTSLNLPDFDGGASVRVFVEDTSAARRRRLRRTVPAPRIRLRIADCVNEANLEFSVEKAELRENSLHKIDTLLGALHRFRDALAAEAKPRARRECGHTSEREEGRCRTRRDSLCGASPQSQADPRLGPGAEQRGRLHGLWTTGHAGRFLVLGSEGGSYYAWRPR